MYDAAIAQSRAAKEDREKREKREKEIAKQNGCFY